MNILGIDSSGLVASVAILSHNILTAEYTINYKKTHSQTLLPMLDEIVRMSNQKLEDLDAIAVAAGPGSFTGLRIGSSTAKGLGLALKKPLISVSSIEGLAYNLCHTDQLVCPIMDAKRNQVYTGLFEFHNQEMITLKKPTPIGIEELIEELNQLGREVIFLGDGVEVYKEDIAKKLCVSFSFAPPHLAKQRAGAIACLGQQLFQKGFYESAAEHKPFYLRLSQAERERIEREEKEGKNDSH